MIAEALILEDRRRFRSRGDAGCRQLVVDPPAHVLGPGLAAVGPPGVAVARRLGMKAAIDIDPTLLFEHARQPGTFFG